MSVIDRGLDSLTFLTDQAREALRRRLRELAGVALLVLSMLLAAALATWSVQDPSLSHATNAPVRNLLGVTGATVSDLVMQLLGLGSLALLLPMATWGWRLAGHRRLAHEPFRIAAWIAGIALATAFASSLPRTAAWPLPAGLGGVVGDALLRAPPLVTGRPLVGVSLAIFSTATGLGTLLMLALSTGLLWRGRRSDDSEAADEEPERNERGTVSLGWIVHGFLSFKSRIARVIAGRRTAGLSLHRDGGAKPGRTEPHFGDYQSALRDL